MSKIIDFRIFFFLLLFLITSQLEIYLIILLFAIIHELAHLFIGIAFGFKIQELKITPLGLRLSFKTKCEEYNNKILNGNSLAIKKCIIATAGPAMNFIVVLLLSYILGYSLNIGYNQSTVVLLENMIYANLLISIFNLIPIYPLDGGRILHEIIHIIKGLNKAHKYTHIISKVCILLLTTIASITILYVHNIAIILILAYLWIIVIRENRVYQNRKMINEILKEQAQNTTK